MSRATSSPGAHTPNRPHSSFGPSTPTGAPMLTPWWWRSVEPVGARDPERHRGPLALRALDIELLPGEQLRDRLLVGGGRLGEVNLEGSVEHHPGAAGLAEPRAWHSERGGVLLELARPVGRYGHDGSTRRLAEQGDVRREVPGRGRGEAGPTGDRRLGERDRRPPIAAVVGG